MVTTKYNIEFIRKEFEKEGYILLSKTYKNCLERLKCRCPNGHEWYTNWNGWEKGNRCGKCQSRLIKPRGRPPGWKMPREVKQKISNSMRGKKKSKKTKLKTSKSMRTPIEKINEICDNLGYTFLNTTYSGSHDKIQYIDKEGVLHNTSWLSFYNMITPASYSSYADKVSYADPVRKAPDNSELLETRCTYCGKWFKPTIMYVNARIACLEGRMAGECRLYCSDGCKNACPIYNQTLWPKGFKGASSREVQPELRQLVLERDGYTCQKCGKTIEEIELHCHHIDPVVNNPIESADMDKCITYCINCHKNSHKQSGCGYYELRCN